MLQNNCSKVSHIQHEQDWPQDQALWNTVDGWYSKRSSCSTTDVLCPAGKVCLEPTQGGACDAKARFKALQEDVIVDGVECRRQVQKDQNGEIAAVDRQQNV